MNNNVKPNIDNANLILNNIFDSCDMPKPSKSLNELSAETRRKIRPLIFHRVIAIIFLFIVVLTPLFFKADPNFMLSSASKTVVVTSHALYSDCFIMTLTGDADYDNIYATKNDGAIVYPERIDRGIGVVVFPYDGCEMNIFIPSTNGGCIQAVLSENK